MYFTLRCTPCTQTSAIQRDPLPSEIVEANIICSLPSDVRALVDSCHMVRRCFCARGAEYNVRARLGERVKRPSRCYKHDYSGWHR